MSLQTRNSDFSSPYLKNAKELLVLPLNMNAFRIALTEESKLHIKQKHS